MFETLTQPPPDKILSLMTLFRADARPDKLDLGVGVYRDRSGNTPILPTVRRAEAALHRAATTKAYVGPAGDARFVALVRDLAFGDQVPLDRLGGIQTTGGAGALRLLAGLIAQARPGATVHLPDPTWVNHVSVLGNAGLRTASYRYFDPATGTVQIDGMIQDIRAMAPGDIVLLHGCCHNPTGADPRPEDWETIVEALCETGVVPFVDLAYQGFGDGLDQDAAPLRLLARSVPEMVVAYSCSKNFGIYRDRAGAAFFLGRTPGEAAVGLAQLTVQSRVACSMPPDHGAALVRDILGDPAAAAEWRAEVDGMRHHISTLRTALSAALTRVDAARFGTLASRKGMFALLPLSQAEVMALREQHAIYMVSDGRINLAGLRDADIPRLVTAIAGL